MHKTSKVKRPSSLKRGDTIGLAPLAGPYSEPAYQRGISILRDYGFKVKMLQSPEQQSYLAGSDKVRLDIFQELWKDTEVAAILAIRGGYGTMRLLQNLDFSLLQDHPKPLIGFSDISGFCNVITQETGLITFHGPNLTTLDQCDRESIHSFFHSLTRSTPFEIKADIEVLRNGCAEGILAGGNLSTITHLQGTPYDLHFEDKILIVEDINEAPYAVDRLFYQLYLSGKLHKLAGLIIGQFSNCGAIETIWRMILDLVTDTTYPIWGNFPVGHEQQNRIWPIGAKAKMDSSKAQLTFTQQVMTP